MPKILGDERVQVVGGELTEEYVEAGGSRLLAEARFGDGTFQGELPKRFVGFQPALRHGADYSHDVAGAASGEELFPVPLQGLARLRHQARSNGVVRRQVRDEV